MKSQRYRITKIQIEKLKCVYDRQDLNKLYSLENKLYERHELLSRLSEIGLKSESDLIVKAADRYTFSRLMRSVKIRFYENYIAESRLILSFTRYLMSRPIIFSVYFHLRAFYYCKIYNKMTQLLSQDGNTNSIGFMHNYSQATLFLTGHRNRTEKFINLLRCINELNIPKSRVLCVGPRNEAEVLLLRVYGFNDIFSIDLFSYSPLIKLMDMHSLAFNDNFFDIYYSAFVLPYSDNIKKVITEAIRVTRPGGIHVFGWTTSIDGVDNYGLTPEGSDIVDFNAFFELVGDSLDVVFWKEIYEFEDQKIHYLIYKVKKIIE